MFLYTEHLKESQKVGFHMGLQLLQFLSKFRFCYNLPLLLLFSLQDFSRVRVLITFMRNRTIESLTDKKSDII